MEKQKFYIIKDDFFNDMKDPYLKGNKQEKRPHYYCLKDDKIHGIYWMIPLSSQVAKYKKIINSKKLSKKRIDTLHIAKLNKKQSVFLIQDMFPIIDKYIEREYTLAGNSFKIIDNSLASKIESKANAILSLIKKGIKLMYTSPDVIKIYNKLINLLINEK